MPALDLSAAKALHSGAVKALAQECGFDLAGITTAGPLREAGFYTEWLARGYAAEMEYLYGRRAEMRGDVRTLLPSARSVICLGILYNTPVPYSTQWSEPDLAWISRYAWGEDYHDLLRARMEELASRMQQLAAFEFKICVDTSPVLERALAQRAGLGWIGHNTCLINQKIGSWVFLGEILVSLELEPDEPAPFRCGSCRKCIEACPTGAIVPTGKLEGPAYALDSRLCISYWTIEHRGPMPGGHRGQVKNNVFGCDICQDVCPWNRRAPATENPAFAPRWNNPPLDKFAAITEEEFRQIFRSSPVQRARYSGFLRNVAVAMGNSGNPRYREALENLAASGGELVREHALWALQKIGGL
ncbi:MAG TPA: tRNA epoxyqueuosine(34) reductase QueG [Bryobacterales bacterium]|jgi:epoxyqueuosine reductase|nr:tRNA epoxyqueuosine(34) reductase QueG [Bryobacterales bacterium]